MFFLDLLRPKWKYGKTAFDREFAVRLLTNQKVLARVATTDPAISVRAKAAARLTDQTLLVELVTTGSADVRRAAANALTDQTLLVELATTGSEDVRLAAVNALTDQTALAELATKNTNDDVRASAVEKVTDQGLLADVIKTDRSDTVRMRAVRALTDQALLAAVAGTHGSLRIRRRAFAQLTDPILLADVTKVDRERISEAVPTSMLEIGAQIDILYNCSPWTSASDPQVKAVGELVRMGTAAVEPLHRLMSSTFGGRDARVLAACALGEIGDVSSIEPLINALEDESDEVISNAIFALQRIGKVAEQQLRQALDRADGYNLKERIRIVLNGIEHHLLARPTQQIIILHSGLIGSYRPGRRLR